ncbi:MAG: lipopolysaccharide biosynthesis protein, partial [Methylocella sp.]
ADPLLLLFLPRGGGASTLAIAQAGAMLAALIVLIFFASRAKRQWPRLRDLAVTVLANGVMSAFVLPMRSQEPGLATLIEQIGTGVAVYAVVVLGFDVAGLRSLTIARLRLAAARMKTL